MLYLVTFQNEKNILGGKVLPNYYFFIDFFLMTDSLINTLVSISKRRANAT